MLTITKKLDISPRSVPHSTPQVINVSQYDSDFEIQFKLYASTGTFTIEEGTTAAIKGTKPSGTGYSADASIDIETKTVTVSGDVQMTAVAGRCIYEIALYKDNKEINSANFILLVERAALDADTITDESVLRNLEAIVEGAETATQAADDAVDAKTAAEAAQAAAEAAAEQAEGAIEVDDTLSVEGRAADAKATGKIREDFENAFTVIRPHDYGNDILLDDLYIWNSQFIEVTRIKDGSFNADKMQNKACYIQFKFNEIPKARAAAPVTYDFSIHIPDSDTIVDVLRFKDGNTVVASTLDGEEQGTMIKSEDTYKLTYEYRNQSVMCWQLTFLPAPAYNKLITVSAIVNGEKTEYNISPSQIEPYLKERDGIAFEPQRNALKEIKYYGVNWTQGACTVLDSYIGFTASADDHSTNGVAKIARFDNFENYTSISHNLGHCASADYNEMTDTMIVANGTDADGVAPAIFLVENASNIVTNKTDIVYGSSGVIEIPLNGIDGEGIIACFGECEKIVYIVTSEDASDFRNKGGKYIYRALLGMGADDMTSVFESDSYGTFISGCADNEYNGTLHILSKFECEFFGELQGLKYINGRLVFPTDVVTDSILTSYLLLVRFNSDSDVFFDKIYWIPMLNNNGTLISTECEDVVFHNGRGYVVTMSKKTGQSNIYRTHVFDAYSL